MDHSRFASLRELDRSISARELGTLVYTGRLDTHAAALVEFYKQVATRQGLLSVSYEDSRALAAQLREQRDDFRLGQHVERIRGLLRSPMCRSRSCSSMVL